MENCQLRALYLVGNYIGDDGILSLSVMLSSEQVKLGVLHIGNNLFTGDGMIILANTVETNDHLHHLYLSDNDLGEEGLEALGNALSYNHAMTLISLSGCNVTDEGI